MNYCHWSTNAIEHLRIDGESSGSQTSFPSAQSHFPYPAIRGFQNLTLVTSVPEKAGDTT